MRKILLGGSSLTLVLIAISFFVTPIVQPPGYESLATMSYVKYMAMGLASLAVAIWLWLRATQGTNPI